MALVIVVYDIGAHAVAAHSLPRHALAKGAVLRVKVAGSAADSVAALAGIIAISAYALDVPVAGRSIGQFGLAYVAI